MSETVCSHDTGQNLILWSKQDMLWQCVVILWSINVHEALFSTEVAGSLILSGERPRPHTILTWNMNTTSHSEKCHDLQNITRETALKILIFNWNGRSSMQCRYLIEFLCFNRDCFEIVKYDFSGC